METALTAFSADALPDADVPPTASAPPPPRARVAVIPAAGFGTRLRPLTNALPKEMLPVGRYLALERIVAELEAAGMTQIVFVLSSAKEAFIRARFGDASASGVSFSYVLQTEMRGLGDAVLCAEPFIAEGQPFVVALGDAVFAEGETGGVTKRLADAVTAHGADTGLVVQRVARERISRYGVVKPAGGANSPADNEPFAIDGIVEKPAPDEAPSEYAAAARYALPFAIFDTLRRTAPGKGGEIQLTDAIKTRLLAGLPGVAVPLRAGEARHDIGSLDSYFKAFVAFALADEEQGPGLRDYIKTLLTTGEGSDGK